MNMTTVPYHLDNFKLAYMSEVVRVNQAEKRQYPPAFVPSNS